MNATELRIGNLVNTINRNGEVHLPDDIVFKVQEIGFDCILCEFGKNPACEKTLPVFSHFDLSPILLTEEWTKKLGCYTKSDWDYKENLVYSLNGKFYYVIDTYFDSDDAYGYVEIEVKYVHQIQNLYFALTGEELKFKVES